MRRKIAKQFYGKTLELILSVALLFQAKNDYTAKIHKHTKIKCHTNDNELSYP